MSSDRARNGTAYSDDDEESAVRRLLVLVLTEALKAGCSEIQIGPGETSFPVHFVHREEVHLRDSLPTRVFFLLRDHVTAMCEKLDTTGRGSFVLGLPRLGNECDVSVAVGDSELNFRIHPSAGMTSAQ